MRGELISLGVRFGNVDPDGGRAMRPGSCGSLVTIPLLAPVVEALRCMAARPKEVAEVARCVDGLAPDASGVFALEGTLIAGPGSSN